MLAEREVLGVLAEREVLGVLAERKVLGAPNLSEQRSREHTMSRALSLHICGSLETSLSVLFHGS